jgi:BirA family biotin operon repressor/biotin-[acetyl-CoA-carboxylase] ligase
MNIPDLSIKWPNDIMSYNKKIGGILIENSIRSEETIVSIVGLGLNVNQTNFENLPKASSLALLCNTYFNKEELLLMIIENLKKKLVLWNQFSDRFWREYTDRLFRKGVPMAFSNQNDQNFMGIIEGVSAIGKLQILLEDDSVAEFDVKEIAMLY